MSAAEIIEQIKQLPPEERREVQSYFETAAVRPPSAAEARYATSEEFKRAAAKVFEENEELLRRLAQ